MQPTLFREGDYVWVRAKVLTAKPLTRFIPLIVVGDGTRMFMVKYEKIPYFCKVCGRMGHGFEECGNGVWKDKDKRWGGWMIAQRREMQFSSSSRGSFPSRGDRGEDATQAQDGAIHQLEVEDMPLILRHQKELRTKEIWDLMAVVRGLQARRVQL
ncbi:hypothetical protein D1007_38856 [Hordeum vulgare]|nr:hypothetical protein D1007_38856 [Hordeum vulgare]